MASKEYANYQATPRRNLKGEITQQCSLCSMFQPPEGCSLVEGKIAPRGWCKFFERKKEAA